MKNLRLPACVLLMMLCHGIPRATQVIANWDVVPYQIFNGTFKLGVVAFHETGVDVEILVNGTLKARVADPTYNDRTDVYEYWVELDAADYSDGEIRVTATVHPDGNGHESRALAEIIMYANAGGSLTNNTVKWVDCDNGNDGAAGTEAAPYKTIEKAYTMVNAGGTVYLKASQNYILTSTLATKNYQYWTTVTVAPGLTRDDVAICGYNESGTSTGRFGETRVHWKNVRMYCDNAPGYGTLFYFESGNHIWFDGVELYDKRGIINGSQPYGGNSPNWVYMTDSYMHDFMNASAYPLMRNMTIRRIGSDIYRPGHNQLGVNVRIDSIGIDNAVTGAHPDFVQFYNPGDTIENFIIYNNKVINMDAQGLFGQNCRDFAVVNLLMEKDPPESYAISQWGGVWDHVLLWHMTTRDAGMILIDDPLTNKSNCNIQDNLFQSFGCAGNTSLVNSTIAYNHFTTRFWDQPTPMGTNYTQGDPGFADTSDTHDDYRVADTSPCYQSGVPLPGVPADMDNVLYHAVTPNRGCYAAGNVNGLRNPWPVAVPVGPSLWLKEGNPVTGSALVLEGAGVRQSFTRVFTAGGSLVQAGSGGRLYAGNLVTGVYVLATEQNGQRVVYKIVRINP